MSAALVVVAWAGVALWTGRTRRPARVIDLGLSAPTGSRRAWQHHRGGSGDEERRLQALIDAGERIVRGIRAGAPVLAVRHALADDAAVADATLRRVHRALVRGAGLAAATALPAPAPTPPRHAGSAGANPDATLLVHALAASVTTGGDPAAPIERAVATLRERQAFRREQRTHAAASRLSAVVLTLLPPVTAGWAFLTSERVREVDLHSPAGPTVLAVGMALNAAGWWWMRRIVQRGGPR